MKPRVSRLRHLITFLQPGLVPDGGGGVKPGWTEAATVAGDFRAVSAGRVLDAESTEVMNRATVRMRAQAVPAAFDALKWRLRVSGADYTILSALDEDGDRRFTTFILGRAG